MNTTHRFPVVRRAPALSRIAAALTVATLVGFAGCGQQATPPAPTAVPAAVPPAPPPVQAPVQNVPAAPVAGVPVQAPPVSHAPGLQAGRPVPTAPYDGPNPPVAYAQVPVQAPPPGAYAPVPVQAPPPVARAPARPAVASNRLGRVASIEPIREKPSGTGAGGVLGGVLGAVVGNRFGHGTGRAAMTVIGAAGGAVAGNTVERSVRERIVGYRVSVDLDNGQVRSYQEANPGDLQVGDRVRVDGQRLRRL